MFENLLSTPVQQFIADHERRDIATLALGQNPFPDIPFPLLLDQVSGKSKAKEKLPRWHQAAGIVYPARVSMEQASSQATAVYKSRLASGMSLIDLTGGFGVDDAYFAESFEKVLHCEREPALSAIVEHNLKVLGLHNVSFFTGDSQEALKSRDHWDCIYIDPSRRHETKGKVFLLSDCDPDVTANLDTYFSRTHRVIVKASPIMDISAAAAQLKNIAAIHIVALRNEVREILFDLHKGASAYTIHTVNLETSQAHWTFDPAIEPEPAISGPLKYLYEPNPAIMKSGGFGALSRDFGLAKLHRHSHLYTSGDLMDFPGRVFQIDKIVPFNNHGRKELSALKKANIATRNFPLTVAELRKRLKIADGGNTYCFFTTGPDDEKIALICAKIG